MATCAVHAAQAATHRCDGCGKLLCDECIRASHRLILCGLCGELALPLTGGAGGAGGGGGRATVGPPVKSTEFRRQRARAAPYSLVDALLYPFRGTGGAVFWSYVSLLLLFDLISLLPLAGCLLVIPRLIILLMLPRLLFTIVRTTAEGDDELPDWPDFDIDMMWSWIGDALVMLGILLVSALPGIALYQLLDCSVAGLLAGECWGVIPAGFFLGVLLWIPTMGATSVYDSAWLLPRLDLHFRALAASPRFAIALTLLLAALFVGSYTLRFALGLVPVAGWLASTWLGVYTLFTGAHLAGVYFRRSFDELERLYVG
ncbi:MAG: B-box zinc finger protein [Thermoanaerobaculia bacterium]